MKVYISGGAKNGKSTLAQSLAVMWSKYKDVTVGADGVPSGRDPRQEDLPLYYVATMIPTDEEDRARIARHVSDREGLGFITIERSKDICGIIARSEAHQLARASNSILQEEICCSAHGVFLLDSVTALLANVMFPQDATGGDSAEGENAGGAWFNPNAAEEVAADLKEFLDRADNVILVSDYIYADPQRRRAEGSDEDDFTGTYMRGLAYIDRTIASLCDEVYEVSAGIVICKQK